MFVLTWFGILGYGSTDAASIAKVYYIGYSVTPLGSVIGAIYGFFDAGIGCFLFASLYNKFTNKQIYFFCLVRHALVAKLVHEKEPKNNNTLQHASILDFHNSLLYKCIGFRHLFPLVPASRKNFAIWQLSRRAFHIELKDLSLLEKSSNREFSKNLFQDLKFPAKRQNQLDYKQLQSFWRVRVARL